MDLLGIVLGTDSREVEQGDGGRNEDGEHRPQAGAQQKRKEGPQIITINGTRFTYQVARRTQGTTWHLAA